MKSGRPVSDADIARPAERAESGIDLSGWTPRRRRTLLERGREALRAAPTHDELVLRLRALFKEELAAGMTSDEALERLEEIRRQDSDYEDIVLDVMDFVTRWSSRHVSLR